MSRRQDQKAEARAPREAVDRHAAADQRRRRTLTIAGLIAAAAVVVVLVVVLASGGNSSDNGGKVEAGRAAPGGPETVQLLGGIPQSGDTLGTPGARLTFVEFNDMQCPVCKEYDAKVFPTLIDRYVRTGKMRMQMRLQSFIGPDSIKGGKAVAAAQKQNKAWDYEHVFYVSQGTENTGYVTDDFLESVGLAVKGLNVDQLMKDRDAPEAQKTLDKDSRDFSAAGFSGTPSFLVGPTGGQLKPLNFSQLDPAQFTKVIDALLAQTKEPAVKVS